jgi:hypothetical protein
VLCVTLLGILAHAIHYSWLLQACAAAMAPGPASSRRHAAALLSLHDCATRAAPNHPHHHHHLPPPAGRAKIKSGLRLCDDVQLDSLADVLGLREWLSGAWVYLAMGDFPYPSSYMLNGNGQLPAFPVRVACSHMAQEGASEEQLLAGGRCGAWLCWWRAVLCC